MRTRIRVPLRLSDRTNDIRFGLTYLSLDYEELRETEKDFAEGKVERARERETACVTPLECSLSFVSLDQSDAAKWRPLIGREKRIL